MILDGKCKINVIDRNDKTGKNNLDNFKIEVI